jgi:diguanylate cyclase (GGDEF)-like protein
MEEWANPRTVVVLTLLLLGALWTVVIVSAVSARQASIVSTGERLQRMTRAVEEQTRHQLRLLDTFLMSCESWLSANSSRNPRSDPAFQRLIEGFRSRTGESIDILLLTANGEVSDVLGKAKGPLAIVADSEYFRGALANPGLFIGSPAPDPSTGHHGLPVALSLQNPAHGIQMLVAVIDLPLLTRAYDEQRQKPGGAITLLRRDGTILARAPHDHPLPGRSLTDGEVFRQHLATQSQAVVRPDDKADTQAGEFISFSSMPDYPLLIMVSESYHDALAAWLRQTVWIVLLALGVTVPLAVVAYRSLRLLQALASQNAQLQHLVDSDRLTGVSSRQHFVETLQQALEHAQGQQSPLTVLLFDIDFFKRINDGYGHAVGDQVLVAFAAVAKRCLADNDLLGRLGGGEFSILLPGTDLGEAVLIAEQVRSEIAKISIPTENGIVQFTASVGASEACATDRSTDDLLKRTAQALHNAKAGGHDRIALA